MSEPQKDSTTNAQSPEPKEESATPPERKKWNPAVGRKAVAFGTAAAAIGGVAAANPGASSGPEAAAEPESVSSSAAKPVTNFEVRQEWDIQPSKNEQVDFFIEFLQFRNRDKTKLWLERLGKYGPMISQKLAERNMPQDLIWLATIESGLNPNAYSKADAAGLWQFIEETGERYGLEVNQYVDERRDPIKATDAALDYLNKMHKDFGSWYLTAAGYNTGENRVRRIVNEQAGGRFGDENVFWEIDQHLPSETRDYVPVMLAMGHIGKDPARYGFTDLQRQDKYEFDEIKVAGGTKLSKVAADLGVDAQEIYDLNPHLLKKMTPPDREWSVRVPKNAEAKPKLASAGEVADNTGDAAAE